MRVNNMSWGSGIKFNILMFPSTASTDNEII